MRKLISILFLVLTFARLSAQKPDSVDVFTGETRTGFTVGVYTFDGFRVTDGILFGAGYDCPLKKWLVFRGQALIACGSERISDSVLIESTFLDNPLHFVFKTGGKRTVPYLLCGPMLRSDLSAGRHAGTTFFRAEIGIGLAHRLQYFTIAPELRASFGKDDRMLCLAFSMKM